MIKELDLVVLNHDVEEHGLRAGDIGTAVHCYKDNSAFEVEFVTAEGKTLALLTLRASEVRARQSSEILHARTVDAAVA